MGAVNEENSFLFLVVPRLPRSSDASPAFGEEKGALDLGSFEEEEGEEEVPHRSPRNCRLFCVNNCPWRSGDSDLRDGWMLPRSRCPLGSLGGDPVVELWQLFRYRRVIGRVRKLPWRGLVITDTEAGRREEGREGLLKFSSGRFVRLNIGLQIVCDEAFLFVFSFFHSGRRTLKCNVLDGDCMREHQVLGHDGVCSYERSCLAMQL